MRIDHKDLTIGENQYRIGKLSAADGSWIFTTFVKRYRAYREAQPLQFEAPADNPGIDTAQVAPEVGFGLTASFLMEQLSREETKEIQSICLGSCGRYSVKTGSPVAMPILLPSGAFAIPELAQDGPAVLELTKECIAFNIAPFFPGAGSNGTPSPAMDSNQPNTQP